MIRLLYFLFFYLLAQHLFTDVLNKIQIENAIKEQIQSIVAPTLDEKYFLVFVAVKIDEERIQEVNTVERDTYKTKPTFPIERTLPTFSELPGFEFDQPQTTPYPNSVGNETQKERLKEKYDYINKTRVKQVTVNVVLDKSVEREKAQEIKNSIMSQIKNSYPTGSVIYFRTAKLVKDPVVEKKTNESIIDKIKDDPVLLGLSILTSVILFLLILLFGLLFLYFFFRTILGSRRKEFNEPQRRFVKPYNPASPIEDHTPVSAQTPKQIENVMDNADKKDNFSQSQGLLTNFDKEREFIVEFTDDPLVSRKYFSELSSDEREVLTHSFDSSTISKIFYKLDGNIPTTTDAFTNLDTQDAAKKKRGILEKGLLDLKYFKKITRLQTTDDFGPLSLLSPEEMRSLLKSIPIKDRVIILKFIDKSISNDYIKSLKEDDKKELLLHLNREVPELSERNFEQLKEIFDKRMDHIAKSVFIQNPNKEDLSKSILDSSKDTKSVLSTMQEVDTDLYEKFKSYQYDQNDLLNENNDYLRSIIEESENDTIAKATFALDENNRQKILSLLPEERQEFIQGIINANRNNLNRDEVDKSMNEIISRYREKKSNEVT